MKIEDIKKYWIAETRSPEEDIKLWDSQADDPIYIETYDNFIGLLESENMINKSFDVLDVGCGAAAYIIGLADKVNSITGMDISPKMLENANKKIKEKGIENTELKQIDWNSYNIKEEGMEEKYDLVFAHNSPAICNVETFEKFNNVSKKYCAICTPISMKEPLMEEVWNIAGIEGQENGCDSGYSFMLDILLQKGYMPKLSYEKQVWPMNQSFEDACAYYIGRTKMSNEISDETVEKIKNYLKGKVIDGVISDAINTTVATIYWEKI